MAAATASSSARRVRPPLLQLTSNSVFVTFPRRPLPATTLALSAGPSQLPLVPAANPKYHKAKVDAGDEDVEREELLRRFNWQVALSAARRFRRRRFKGPYPLSDDHQGAKEQASDDEENDNWELPAGELPSYR